eukprot:4331223-Amphidinium_carterae.1
MQCLDLGEIRLLCDQQGRSARHSHARVPPEWTPYSESKPSTQRRTRTGTEFIQNMSNCEQNRLPGYGVFCDFVVALMGTEWRQGIQQKSRSGIHREG